MADNEEFTRELYSDLIGKKITDIKMGADSSGRIAIFLDGAEAIHIDPDSTFDKDGFYLDTDELEWIE